MVCLVRCLGRVAGSHFVQAARTSGLVKREPCQDILLRVPARSITTPGVKVTICGAAGCTGQPLALLLKQCPLIDELALYDQCATCGMAVELSHVDTKPKVCAYSGRHMIYDALKDSSVVVIVAKDKAVNSFDCNAPIVSEIAIQISNACPECFTIMATEPVESLTVVAAEILRLRGAYNPRRVVGCVELNCVRANTVLADFLRVPPESVRVPVVGGAAPNTMVPVLSAACHPGHLSHEQIECVTSCIMGGTEAVCRSKGLSSAIPCLAGAFAIARNTINVVKGMAGDKNVQCCYLDSLGTCVPDCQFFACDGVFGPSGVEKVLGPPELSKYENCLLCNALPFIRNEQARAVWLVYKMCDTGPGNPPCRCWCPPPMPCGPCANWGGMCPDAARDEYLAKICRDMTCRCGCTPLCWVARDVDYDHARATNLKKLWPVEELCPGFVVPRSVAIQQCLQERARDPLVSNS